MAFPDGIADFRSDTVTRPTAEMRKAMANADVGDDVYGEDPTVRLLQEACADLVGTEAALFVPSGTMGNQIAISVHTRPGDGLICARTAHVARYEGGGPAAQSGVQLMYVDTPNGEITADQVAALTASNDHHLPRPSLLTWENTHNVSGGTLVPLDMMSVTGEKAREAGLAIHLDGARLMNACAATGVSASDYVSHVDSVQFCLSKGLGAPVGSIVAGSAEFVEEAHRRRKRFGGGMRQAGIIAAAGLLALEHRGALKDDHALAQSLASAVEERFSDVVSAPQTNIVVIDETRIETQEGVTKAALAAAGILVGYIGPRRLRFVMHRDVNAADVARVLAALDALRNP